MLVNPEPAENKGESNHLPEIPENVEIVSSSEETDPFVITPFSGPDCAQQIQANVQRVMKQMLAASS